MYSLVSTSCEDWRESVRLPMRLLWLGTLCDRTWSWENWSHLGLLGPFWRTKYVLITVCKCFNFVCFHDFHFGPVTLEKEVSISMGSHLVKQRLIKFKNKWNHLCSTVAVAEWRASPPQSIMLYSLGLSSGQQSYSLLSRSCQQTEGPREQTSV